MLRRQVARGARGAALLVVLAGFMLFSFGSLGLIKFIGSDFFPTVDAGQIRLHMRAATGTRIEETARLADQVESAIRELVPPSELETILDNIGVPNSGINLSYSNAGTIGTIDGEIQISTAFRPGVRLLVPGSKTRVSLPLEFCIRDNGPGVPEDLMPHLFDPFVTTKPTGSGLGLAIAKALAARGCRVAITARTKQSLEKATRALKAELAQPADVADEGLAAILSRPGISPVNRDAGGSGEISGGPPAPFDRPGDFPRHAEPGADDAPRFDGADAEDAAEEEIGGDVQDPDEGIRQDVKPTQRIGNPKRAFQRALDGERLWGLLAGDDVQEGDDRKANRERHAAAHALPFRPRPA